MKVSYCNYCLVLLLSYYGNAYTQSEPSVGHVCTDGCHVCFVNEYHEHIKLPIQKTGVCDTTGKTLHNGDFVCMYGYNMRHEMYLVHENITTADGCNSCLCTTRGALCTKVTCDNTGFAKPSDEPLYGECNDNGRWYKFKALWEADDGCNTCTCVGIGNYQGPFICTQGLCINKESPVVG
ncbi:unnamed protein product [Mytilus coruscus]|uniref:VWFC domain-containing protein n=1 Tax=Mytilus coruscus TaxID=42192 RepID=A0A6J8EFE9_MYTCO|nr:unnamed protein product [Mytilus coruscus]